MTRAVWRGPLGILDAETIVSSRQRVGNQKATGHGPSQLLGLARRCAYNRSVAIARGGPRMLPRHQRARLNVAALDKCCLGKSATILTMTVQTVDGTLPQRLRSSKTAMDSRPRAVSTCFGLFPQSMESSEHCQAPQDQTFEIESTTWPGCQRSFSSRPSNQQLGARFSCDDFAPTSLDDNSVVTVRRRHRLQSLVFRPSPSHHAPLT